MSRLKLFLAAKPWQLFLVTLFIFVVPSTGFLPGPGRFLLAEVIMTGLGTLWFGWIYTVGTAAHACLAPTVRSASRLFRVSVIYAATYYVAFTFLADPTQPTTLLLLMPFHFAAVVAILYSMVFVARQLATLRVGYKAHVLEGLPEFLSIWFFPVGIWFVQPLVNERLAPQRWSQSDRA